MLLHVDSQDCRKFGEEFLQDIVNWVGRWFEPAEVFSNDELSEWAEDNGWTEEA